MQRASLIILLQKLAGFPRRVYIQSNCSSQKIIIILYSSADLNQLIYEKRKGKLIEFNVSTDERVTIRLVSQC
jgi:hypothetical protein